MTGQRDHRAIGRLVGLRKSRVDALEAEMRSRREALAAAQAAHAASMNVHAAWQASLDALHDWARRSETELHRQMATYDTRRRELTDGVRAAGEHVQWCAQQVEAASTALEAARLAWTRAMRRLEALQARQRDVLRRWSVVREEAAVEDSVPGVRMTMQEQR